MSIAGLSQCYGATNSKTTGSRNFRLDKIVAVLDNGIVQQPLTPTNAADLRTPLRASEGNDTPSTRHRVSADRP
jgi:hypothetical protein